MNKWDTTEWYAQRKAERMELLRVAKSDGCMVCGETDIRCLDLHHRNPEDKKFTLSSANWSRKIADWIAEVAKCDCLCANCHRKVHYQSNSDSLKDYGLKRRKL